MRSLLRSTESLLLDVFFPRRCFNCQVVGAWMCEPCASALSAKFLFEGVEKGVTGLFSLEEGAVREMLHSLKYEGIHEAADAFVEVLGKACAPTELLRGLGVAEGERVVVVPVPTSLQRLGRRGYNQAELLAASFARWANRPLEPMLLQKRKGKSLVGQGKHARQLQALSSFFVPRSAVVDPGVFYVLVDDVATTGSTLKSCAFALREAGARRVTSIAFGYKHRTEHEKEAA